MTAVLEVFADVRCPFTYVGLRRILAERTALGRTEPRIWVRAWPLELVNGEPLSASLVDSEVTALRAQVSPDLFRGFRAASFGRTSLPALALANAAYRVSPATGEAVSMALRHEAFENGRDVGDVGLVAAIAGCHGIEGPTAVDESAVVADWHEGQARGVVGSPHFFVRGSSYFCPALSISHDDDGFRVAIDDTGLETFFRAIFDD